MAPCESTPELAASVALREVAAIEGAQDMIFEQVATGGCQSYLVGCADTLSAVLIDPEIRQNGRDGHYGITGMYERANLVRGKLARCER